MKLFIKFTIFFYLIFLNSTIYAEDKKIVYIDIDKIFNESLVGKSMLNQINELKVISQKSIKKKEEEIKKEDQNINNQKNILSDEEIKNKVDNLRDKIKKLQNELKESNDDIKNKRNLATEEILSELRPILADYSKNNSISLVLRKKNIIIGKNNLDITDDIIEILNKNLKEIKLN